MKLHLNKIVTIGLIVILISCYATWMHYVSVVTINNTPPELQTGTLIPQARTLNNFNLTDLQGKPLTKEELKGHWTFLFFGFTHCPQPCPATFATLNQVYTTLHQQPAGKNTRFLFVSIDPDRDTPDHIATYLTSFNKNFLGATGSKDELDSITQEFSVLYTKVTNTVDQEYSQYNLNHSGTILLINPEGKLQAMFSMPHTAQSIASDFEKVKSYYG